MRKARASATGRSGQKFGGDMLDLIRSLHDTGIRVGILPSWLRS
ncbi:hypothetical protein CCP2SC5_1230003 [Azospirillaceae bacterium]